MTSILLVDDHQLVRQALRRALEDAGFEIVGEARDGEEAVALAASLRPEVIVMDMTMPIMNGVEAGRIIVSEQADVRILLLTMHDEPALVADAISAGVVAFLTKDSSMHEVVETVRRIATGEVLLTAEIAAAMLAEMPAPVVGSSPLSKREREVLQLAADGLSTTEIAETLFISTKTVKNHLANVYDKLEARDRTQAVLSGFRLGIITLR